MKLTKYGHACLALEEAGQRLIIDPGAFSPDFDDTHAVVGVVVTHAHGDHYSPEYLDAIFTANPEATLYTTQEVADEYARHRTSAHIVVVHNGQTETAGPFTLAFSGDLHALNHQSLPPLHNTAVYVNDVFFYPGDSYTTPLTTPQVLAVPTNAPWMRASESMDYITQVKPARCFGTHDALLSDAGLNIYESHLQAAAKAAGTHYEVVRPGDTIEL